MAPPLDTIQGNILRPHARLHADHLMFSFGPRDPRALLRLLRKYVTSAAEEVERNPTNMNVFGSVMISGRGARNLHLPISLDEAFAQGMQARSALLSDPPAEEWHDSWREPIDGMVMLASNDMVALSNTSTRIIEKIVGSGGAIATVEHGDRLGGGNTEHFGFVDGISQPPVEDVEKIDVFDVVLVREPSHGYGSFVVFRKLEQDVEMWDRIVRERATVSGLAEALVAARIMGRWHDGSPLVRFDSPTGHVVPDNDFDYALDSAGLRCPLTAHTRKSNPRDVGSKLHQIVRRGIPYGVRPDLVSETFPRPARGVGLLFICYQADIVRQFEFIQIHWLNSKNHPQNGAGIDLIGGQTVAHTGPVRFVGGEYFYVPSIPLLHSI